MVERYVDELRVNLVRYDGMALAPNVIEGWAFRVGVGEAIDRDQLIDELQDSVVPEPFVLDEKYGLYSWGADAAYLEIVIGVMGGLPGLLYTVDKIMSAYRSKKGHGTVDFDTAQAAAVSAIASARQMSKTAVEVTSADRTDEGYDFEVAVDSDRYRVRVDQAGVGHFEKLQ